MDNSESNDNKNMTRFDQKYSSLDAATCARYSRQLLLPEISAEGQHNLLQSSALVIGAGGLGCPLCQYLAGSGVGTIGIVDGDTVDLSNLHRQVLHREIDAKNATNKAESIRRFISELNSDVKCVIYPYHFDVNNALELARQYDILIDCSDNAATRYLVNYAAVKCGKPLISGAALKWDGQFAVYNLTQTWPCYRCVFPVYMAPIAGAATSCDAAGVCGPVVGMVAMMQALHAIRLLAKLSDAPQMEPMLHLFDGLTCQWRRVKLIKRRPHCPDCSGTGLTQLDTGVDQEFLKFWSNVSESQQCQSVQLLPNSDRLKPSELAADLTSAPEKCLLVDVRSAGEFDIAHLPQSINIPIDLWTRQSSSKLQNVDRKETPPAYVPHLQRSLQNPVDQVVLICRRGNDSQIAAKRLQEDLSRFDVGRLVTRVFDLRGGLHAWSSEIDSDFPVY